MDTWSTCEKRTQNEPNLSRRSLWRSRNEPKFKKAKMNVTSILTVGYENKPTIRAPKKRTQISKRQKPIQTSLPKGIMKKTTISASDKTKPNKANLSRRSLSRSRIKPNLSCRSLWRSRNKANLMSYKLAFQKPFFWLKWLVMNNLLLRYEKYGKTE